jgi:adenylate kinase
MSERIFLVLLGVPGAGKGTQAKLLESQLNLPQVSTGDIFRFNLKNQTDLGVLAKSYMDKGELVPDSVTIEMVKDRLTQPDCAQGAIMDGFPRNLVQARAFDEIICADGGVDLVPLITLEDDEAMRRITGRRVCRSCGAVYHIDFNPPTQKGICDIDGGELYQRQDDQPETVRNRLYVYYKQTAPLIGYYFAHDLLAEIDGNQSIEAINQILTKLLREKGI